MPIKINPLKFVPDAHTSVEEWIEWHKALKYRYGRKSANHLWIMAWTNFGSEKKNVEMLRDYLEKNKLKLEVGFFKTIIDMGGDIADYIGDIFVVGKYVAIGFGIILVGGIGLLVFNIARKPGETIGTAAKILVKKGM